MGRFQDPGCTIFVKNIETRVSEEHLWELFLQAGPLRNVHIPLDRGTGRKRNFAFITYRDEMSVDYACQLFHQVRLFKKPIYCSPSNKDGGKPSFNQSPSNRSSVSDPSQSPSSNQSLIDGILQRSNSSTFPMTSTPFAGKRKYSQDGRSESGRMPHDKGDSRVIVLEEERNESRHNNSSDRERGRYSEHDDRDGRRYGEHDDRDRRSYNSSSDRERGRYDDSYRSNKDFNTGYNRSDNRDNSRDGERRYDDRSPGQGSRYERSNSYGNLSPMHMQAVNQSLNRQNSSSRENSNFGPMRQDSHKNARRHRNQPY